MLLSSIFIQNKKNVNVEFNVDSKHRSFNTTGFLLFSNFVRFTLTCQTDQWVFIRSDLKLVDQASYAVSKANRVLVM